MDDLSVDDIPELPGFVSIGVAAARFGVHKATLYYMIKKQRRFKSVVKVMLSGADGSGEESRPVLLLSKKEVKQVFAERAQAQAREKAEQSRRPATQRALIQEWTWRVKNWGLDTNWRGGQQIYPSGPPVAALVRDYLTANPDDPRPE